MVMKGRARRSRRKSRKKRSSRIQQQWLAKDAISQFQHSMDNFLSAVTDKLHQVALKLDNATSNIDRLNQEHDRRLTDMGQSVLEAYNRF